MKYNDFTYLISFLYEEDYEGFKKAACELSELEYKKGNYFIAEDLKRLGDLFLRQEELDDRNDWAFEPTGDW